MTGCLFCVALLGDDIIIHSNEYWLAGIGNPILRLLNYDKTQKKTPQYKLGGLRLEFYKYLTYLSQ